MSFNKSFTDKSRLRKSANRRVSIPHPVGLNGKPVFPLTEQYAKCALLMHKPWSIRAKLNFEKYKDISPVQEYLAYIDDENCCLQLKTMYDMALETFLRDKFLGDMADNHGREDNGMNSETENVINAYGCKSTELEEDDDLDFGLSYDWSTRLNVERDLAGPGESWLQDTIQLIRTDKERKVFPIKNDGSSYKIQDVLCSDEQTEIVFMVLHKLKEWTEYKHDCTNNGRTKPFKPLHMTVQGPGGTGKSFVINVIVTAVEKLFLRAKVTEVVAPTGSAAYNVGGKTFHSTFLLDWRQPWKNLGSDRLEILEKKLLRTLVLIIDERSLVSMELLGCAKHNAETCAHGGTNRTTPWGGIPIVLAFGDDHQLPSINPGAPMAIVKEYKPSPKRSSQSIVKENIGREAFIMLTDHVKELTVSKRIASDAFDLKNITSALRTEEGLQQNHVDQLLTLRLDNPKLSKERKEYVEDKAMWIFYTRQDCHNHNRKMLKKIHSSTNPVARMYAKLITSTGAKHFTKREQRDRNCDTARGSRMSIDPDNLCADIGLFHGATGTTIETVYEEGDTPNAKKLPLYCIIEMDKYTGPVWDKNHPKQIPIPVITRLCINKCCTLQYIPLSTAFAKTLHTFQGQEIIRFSIKHIMVFSCETLIIESKYPGWLYTGISRVDSIGNGDIEISSLYFVPKNAEENRFINVRTKQRSNGVFKRVKERDDWITYLQTCKKTVTFSDDHKDTLLHWAENVQIQCETLDDIIDYHNNNS